MSTVTRLLSDPVPSPTPGQKTHFWLELSRESHPYGLTRPLLPDGHPLEGFPITWAPPPPPPQMLRGEQGSAGGGHLGPHPCSMDRWREEGLGKAKQRGSVLVGCRGVDGIHGDITGFQGKMLPHGAPEGPLGMCVEVCVLYVKHL